MSIEALSHWREPLAADWREQAKALSRALKAGEGEAEAHARGLRRLAGMRLDNGERLHLRRLVQAARARGGLPGFRGLRVLLVSNRTTSFLAPEIEAAGAARALLVETVETGFDSVAALAYNPAYPAPEGPFDATFLLLDHAYFANPAALLDGEGEAGAAEAVERQLEAVVETLRAKARAPVILATLPTPPDLAQSLTDVATPGTLTRKIALINAAIARLGAAGRAIPFDLATLAARIGSLAFFDPVRLHQAKTPFSLEASPVVADALCATLAAMAGKSARALVLDLDNTLWGGVVADDGLSGIVLGQGSAEGEAFLAFQRHALALRERGVVLAVCSKNLEEVAREPFRSHPDMLLREEHIAVFVANFDDKASNIARIARSLDLDTGSLVFVDDNPAERERVRAMLPFTHVPEVGEDAALFARTLVLSGVLEHLPLTRDDAGRAAAYKARAQALAERETIGDYAAYLASLEMELTIAPFDAIGRARIAQLFQKSNQFNLTTRRYTEADIEAIEQDPARLGWQVRLKDRFADHGMISAVIVDKGAQSWAIDSWIMSCRVLERGVEQALMREILTRAQAAGAREITGTYLPTARNALVKDFFLQFGFAEAGAVADGTAFRQQLANIRTTPPPMAVVCRG